MTGVYRPNPAVSWRYREPNRFVALHSVFVAPSVQEDLTPLFAQRNARHPWIYTLDPDVQWHYHGRRVVVPITTPEKTAIELPAGQMLMFGATPSVDTGQIEGLVQVPMQYPTLAAYGGVYRPQRHIGRRFVTIAEGSPAPPASGVEINAPAGVANFLGQIANLGDTIVNAALGQFAFVGNIASIVAGTITGVRGVFQAQQTTATFQEDHTTRVFLPEDTDVREL